MENGYNCQMPVPNSSSALSVPSSTQPAYPLPAKVESEVTGMLNGYPNNSFNLFNQNFLTAAHYANHCNYPASMAQNGQTSSENLYNMAQNTYNAAQNPQMNTQAMHNMNMNMPAASPQEQKPVMNGQMNAQNVNNNNPNVQMNNADLTGGSEFSEGAASNDSGVSSDESRPLTGDAMQQVNQYQDFQRQYPNPMYPFGMDWLGMNKSWQPWQMQQMPNMNFNANTLNMNMNMPAAPAQQQKQVVPTQEDICKRVHQPDDLTGKVDDISDEDLKNRIKVELKEKDLWEQFSKLEMEMIITKTGRNLFPKLAFTVTGLEPDNRYMFYIHFRRQGDQKYKFMKGQWVEGGKAEEEHNASPFPHSDNSRFSTGATWMSCEVAFPKLKLTNNAEERNNHHAVVLRSMHKYTPVLTIHRFDPTTKRFKSFVEKEITTTTFIAVTAYQNADVTNLKIRANPFAKGFREGGRKRGSSGDSPVPPKTAHFGGMNSTPYPNFGYFGNLGMNMPGMTMPGMGLPNFPAMNSYFNAMPYFNNFSSMFKVENP